MLAGRVSSLPDVIPMRMASYVLYRCYGHACSEAAPMGSSCFGRSLLQRLSPLSPNFMPVSHSAVGIVEGWNRRELCAQLQYAWKDQVQIQPQQHNSVLISYADADNKMAVAASAASRLQKRLLRRLQVKRQLPCWLT